MTRLPMIRILLSLLLLVLTTSGVAQDNFEPDQDPLIAKPGNIGRIGVGESFVPQARSMFVSGDVDWIAIQPVNASAMSEVFHVRLLQPVGGSLHLETAVYDTQILTTPTALPLTTHGSCSQAAPDPNNFDVILNNGNLKLLRIRECNDAVGDYSLRIRYDEDNGRSNAALVTGQVRLAGDPPGVPVLLLTTQNDATFSDPATGAYEIAINANQTMDLSVASPDWEPLTLEVPMIPSGASGSLPVIELLPAGERIFEAGFE